MNHVFELQLARFIESMQTRRWSTRTIESYRAQVRYFFDYLQAEAPLTHLQEIEPKTLQGYQNYLYTCTGRNGRSLSLSTQNIRLVGLRAFFRFLYDTEVIFNDPSTKLQLPRRPKHLPAAVMSEAQVLQLLEQPPLDTPLGFRDRTILEVLYSSAIRNSELRNLSIYDLDLAELSLSIRCGKGAKDRITPLGEIAADFLKEYLELIRPKLAAKKEEITLFLSKNGRPITCGNLIAMMEKYLKQAGLISRFTPHSLRHSCATHMLKGGADIRYLQQMLGHQSVTTTQIYTRVAPIDLKAVHRRYHPREREDNYDQET